MDSFSTIGPISHFLIDYDGFIVDSERLYFESWRRLLNNEGKEVCKKYHEGRHESEVYEKVKAYLLKPMTLEEVSKAKRKVFDQLVLEGKLKPIEGILDLLEKLRSVAPLSVVSNSTIEIVQAGLKSTGMESYFEKMFCYNSKVNRKPAPDLYNLALSNLNLKKESVLAFEDSISGIEAAINADIKVVCISISKHAKEYARLNKLTYFKSMKEAKSHLIFSAGNTASQ